ncbi:MAG TPA: choice-of-anchor tandem repeat GloVer-containing protein [Terriglobia bacterium]
MNRLNGCKTVCALSVLCLATAIALPAQTYTVLHSFYFADGQSPDIEGPPTQATDGNLYGVTYTGGLNGGGTIFKITPSGTFTTFYNFCVPGGCFEGAGPYTAPIQAADGNLYGTTEAGGTNGAGTVFKITLNGKITSPYSFCSQSDCADGEFPNGLIQATDGNFYGTAYYGGASNHGTVFKITPGGALTTLHSFCSESRCVDGEYPYVGLIQATNGNFYGTTYSGGANGFGTVFRITPSGRLTTLYSFCSQSGCTDGTYPEGGLMQAANGNFYGTTHAGGAYSSGTAFKITSGGTLTVLYTFCSQGGSGCTDGANPIAGLIQATDGNFYGTSQFGGVNAAGTIFRVTPSGTLETLHNFCFLTDCADGGYPEAPLVQDTNGNFYGTALGSGELDGLGTFFSLSAGLGPFVETQTTSGKVGAVVKILGTGLTGATSVTFNGTAAVFNVVSSSLIEATVPPGATSGRVQVVTPGGTLIGNVNFRVSP